MRRLTVAALATLVAGCTATDGGTVASSLREGSPAQLIPRFETTERLAALPAPTSALDVAVYAFPDRSGQFRPVEEGVTRSRAVTQGADALLIDVLERAGDGGWFNVIERGSVNDLAQERNIIKDILESEGRPRNLPTLRFAEYILAGGIVSYDANSITGGAGARFLSIGANTEYRRDVVTIALRVVSVATGDVLTSVTTTKTLYSILGQGQLFRFVAVDEILELEAGVSRNEPTTFAVRQAIELAVYATLLEGARKGLWSFSDPVGGEAALAAYARRYEGELPTAGGS